MVLCYTLCNFLMSPQLYSFSSPNHRERGSKVSEVKKPTKEPRRKKKSAELKKSRINEALI